MIDKEKQYSFLLHQDIEPPSTIKIYPFLFCPFLSNSYLDGSKQPSGRRKVVKDYESKLRTLKPISLS
jgi:hypothetical protein